MSLIDYDTNGMSGFAGYNGGFRTSVPTTGARNPYDLNNAKHIDLDKIYDLTPKDYHLTPDDIKQYIYGIRIIDPDTKQELPEDYWNTFIKKAVSQAEMELGITIFPTLEARESHDYDEADFDSNNFIMLKKRPIIQVQDIQLVFNNQPILSYPPSMWKVYHLGGQIKTFPADLINSGAAINNTLSPLSLGLTGNSIFGQMGGANGGKDMPQTNVVTYVAGLLPPAHPYRNKEWEMPEALRALISKYVLKEAVEIWGELILKPGIAGSSVSVDGISQTVQSTLSAQNTGGTARIMLMNKEIEELREGLKNYFGQNYINL